MIRGLSNLFEADRTSVRSLMRPLGVLLIACVLVTGCAVPYIGGPSATVLSRSTEVSGRFEAVTARVERSECFNWVLFLYIQGVMAPSHEALISRTLDEFDADILLDTQLSTGGGGFPLLFMRQCVTLEGVPARLRTPQAASATRALGQEG